MDELPIGTIIILCCGILNPMPQGWIDITQTQLCVDHRMEVSTRMPEHPLDPSVVRCLLRVPALSS